MAQKDSAGRRRLLDRGEWGRNLAIAAVAAVFLALSGAFGTGSLPLPLRLLYWAPLMVLGTVWGEVMAHLLLGPGRRKPPAWAQPVLLALAIAGLLTPVVWLGPRLVFGAPVRLADLPGIAFAVVVISLIMTVIDMQVAARRRAAEAAAPASPRFLERLPLKLRGAELWAVEAEDHYLRLHTSKGQDLILMRLSDAVDELEGIEGAQVHRSWWVARTAIADAKRGDGRATLTLRDGSEVPVSRTYARELRDKGWI